MIFSGSSACSIQWPANGLASAAQARLEHIFVSHRHLDHIKDILFLADNLIEFFTESSRPPLQIHGLPEVLDAIAAGAVAPDVGRLIIDSIKSLSDIRATEELSARIEVLEARDARG